MKDVLKDIKISQIEMIINNLLFKDISDMDLDIWKKIMCSKTRVQSKVFQKTNCLKTKAILIKHVTY